MKNMKGEDSEGMRNGKTGETPMDFRNPHGRHDKQRNRRGRGAASSDACERKNARRRSKRRIENKGNDPRRDSKGCSNADPDDHESASMSRSRGHKNHQHRETKDDPLDHPAFRIAQRDEDGRDDETHGREEPDMWLDAGHARCG